MTAGGPADPRHPDAGPGAGAAAEVVIKVRDDGPYKVTGPVRLVDPDGGEWRVPAGESVALCRCGRSGTKPFCDRSHRAAGFASCERAPGGSAA